MTPAPPRRGRVWRLLQPAFRPERLRRYAAPALRQAIAETTDGWRPGQRVDLVDDFFSLATRAAVRTLFDAEADPRAADELQNALDVFLKGVYRQALTPWSRRLPTPGSRRYARALALWRAHTDALIAGRTPRPRGTCPSGLLQPPEADAGRRYERRHEGPYGQRTDEAPAGHGDVLSTLLAARATDGSQVTDRTIHDQVTSLLLAGAETTAASLSWACHLVALDPGVQERLQAEADEILHGRPAAWEDLPGLRLTGRIVTEALRLYPPAWLIPRVTTRETELAGRRLPVGTTVVCSPFIVHRQAALYPEPRRFRPDRWADGEGPGITAAAEAARGTYLPFGLGAHRCIGEPFAFAETTLALASVAARWSLRPVAGAPVRPAARAVLAPQRLPTRVHPRRPGGF